MAEKKVSVRLVAENGRQVRAELEGVGNAGASSFRRMSAEVDRTGVMLRRLAGIAAGALSVRQVAHYADQWADLRSRVDLAVGSQEKGAAVMDRLAAMARRTYSSLGQTAESWLANATALRELGMSTRESLDFTEALNNAMVVSGAKAERAASVQNALSKAMAGGKLAGQNLNTVIESGGRLAELLAAELGTTVSGLRKMGRQGAITGDVIRSALVGNLELLREEAESMPATISDAFTLIGNAALQLVGTWDQLSGASSLVADVLIMVADNLDRLAAIGIAFAAFMAGRWVAAFVAARIATFSLATALTVLRTAIIRTGIGALIVGAGELIHQFGKLVQRVGGLGTAFRLMGGVALEVGQRIGAAFSALLGGISRSRFHRAGRHRHRRDYSGGPIYRGLERRFRCTGGDLGPAARCDRQFCLSRRERVNHGRRGDAERCCHPHQPVHRRDQLGAVSAAGLGGGRRRDRAEGARCAGSGPDR
ncbi:MAG: tape measure protein [Paracoccus sp. (in: a-proteobacteria)]|nr:tape measure protein [Paracoccus sp. (in: a-proteobacteria)]